MSDMKERGELDHSDVGKLTLNESLIQGIMQSAIYNTKNQNIFQDLTMAQIKLFIHAEYGLSLLKQSSPIICSQYPGVLAKVGLTILRYQEQILRTSSL